MPSPPTRRTLLGTVGIALTAGCLSDDDDDDRTGGNRDERDDSDTGNTNNDDADECNIVTRTGQGQSDPLETTATVDDVDDLEERCAEVAADAAIGHLDDSLDVDLTDPESYWITSVAVRTDDGYRVEIRIVARYSTQSGSYSQCPPEEFEIQSAIEALPRRVNVILNTNGEKNGYECSHEAWAMQEERGID
ncbi:hypothetical protein [Natranaeroarchaeum aerophilus]|uniref:Lipoprotein n=1 Tax=Natranaeroarchaeum aerophilus TaxID=2917711 RepID=A0AAE3FNC8_9EURY|nr:hypothetical protein [Natranaeroarchaeum aerophilus]MCL9812210.1 hypothetical protein [Natranaeroarchaeum aerophilus]